LAISQDDRLKALVRWGGVAITSGFDSSHMGLGVSRDVSSNFGIPSSVTNGVNVDVTGDATGNAVFKIDMTTRSIPVEVTTSVRLLTLLTAYAAWLRLAVGRRERIGLAMNASMIAHIPGQPDANWHGVCSCHVSRRPSAAKVRGILGAQVDLWLIRLFAQLNVANTSPTMASVAVGARVAY